MPTPASRSKRLFYSFYSKRLIEDSGLHSGMEDIQVKLPLTVVLKHLGENFNFLGEGDKVLKAGHVMDCLIQEKKDKNVTIYAYVLQSSHPNNNPHRVIVHVRLNQNLVTDIVNVTCSCKGGLSGVCKHATAVLLYINQVSSLSMEKVTCTGEVQKWSKIKCAAKLKYIPQTIMKMEYTKQVKKSDFSAHDSAASFSRILDAVPQNCSFLRHCSTRSSHSIRTMGQHIFEDYLQYPEDAVVHVKELLANSEHSEHYATYEVNTSAPGKICFRKVNYLHNATEEVTKFYKKFIEVDAIKIEDIARYKQQTAPWKEFRRHRITGSMIHRILQSTDMEKTVRGLVKPSCTTEAMKYGIVTEKDARKDFQEKFGLAVFETGLIVNKSQNHYACSPDGIVINDNGTFSLLEIKCPYVCKDVPVKEVVGKKITYLERKEGTISLHQKRRGYYAQVQFNLHVLNLKEAYFHVYSKWDSVSLVIERDELYIREMMQKAELFYFEYFLPFHAKHCK